MQFLALANVFPVVQTEHQQNYVFLSGLYPSFTRFFYFYLYVVLLVNVSVSYGYFVSAAAPNTTVSLLLGPALAMPLLIVGGFFIKPE